MTDDPAAIRIETAAITDRGLNERRPHNEDSMLSDTERRIFAVADGVGGAEAGEVASQTAIEILQEAFAHHREGDDPEDLMEIAIQRANDSIYRLSREEPRFSMMATTVVTLHLNGWEATVGHVGDSRLYRLTPDGSLLRETADHSLVEEEVRAGRMTAQQAVNHPSRNIISRALGAEPAVEVDLKKFAFENGTTFLLCSDGITRHVRDEELSAILRGTHDLNQACEEMKRLCFERGAEDNLTAVLVRVGDGGARFPGVADSDDEEVTLVRDRATLGAAGALSDEPLSAAAVLRRPFDDAGAGSAHPPTALAIGADAERTSHGNSSTSNGSPPARKSGTAGLAVLMVFLLLAVAGLAFYVGMSFERKLLRRQAETAERQTPSATAAPLPTAAPPATAERAESQFELKRKAVDLSPAAEASRMAAETDNQPLNSDDPEFLYLYGRAMLLTDRQQDAVAAFDRAIERINENMTPRNGELKIDARLAAIAAHVRSGNLAAARQAADALGEVIRAERSAGGGGEAGAGNTPPAPGVTPF